MPRPTKLTPEVQQRFVQAIAVGSTRRLACQFAGISESTLGTWTHLGERGRSPYVAFLAAVKKAEGEALVRWLLQIDAAASEGTWQAAAWKLERRYPEEYGRQVISGPEGKELVLRVVYEGEPPG